MARLLRLWLAIALALAAAEGGAAGAAMVGAPHPQEVPVAVRPLAGFHGASVANAKVGYHCDWPGQNDYINMASQTPSDCVTQCTMYKACTHFTYQPLPGGGGRCYLKRGPATAKSATLRIRGSVVYTCGLLPERLASIPSVKLEMDSDDVEDDMPVTKPTPSPVAEPAGFHGDTLGNALVGHNCDWPRMNDFADMPSSSPSNCLSLCNARGVCTHFVYEKTVGYGGWCHLKKGPVTVEEATLWGPSSTTYTCGLLLERLAPSPSPTAAPTQAPAPSNSVDSAPTATPTPDSPSVSYTYNATCNTRKEDCDDTKATIMGRYLSERCLPKHGGGLLAMSAAALSDALTAIHGYGCCAREEDRVMLLSVARFLVSSDTCAAENAAPLPTKAIDASLINSTTVECPHSEQEIPPVTVSVTALGALGVLSSDLAAAEAAEKQTNRRQVRQLVRSSAVIDITNPNESCCDGNFVYEGNVCCPDWCWIVADLLPFFDLHMCCKEAPIHFASVCPS